MSIRGDTDGSFPSPKYHGEEKNEYGESNLTPNFAISPAGIDISELTSSSLADTVDDADPLYRFLVHVSPFKDTAYPQNVNDKAVIFLDSAQLFTLKNYKFGEGTSISSPQSNEPFYYNTDSGGVYDDPTPLRGGPIEFRRVYFRGKKVDPEKGHVTDESEKTFAAYFPCSLPVEQTITQSSESASEGQGTLYNSRDLNFSYSEYANVLSWEDIDIGGGGGASGSGCNPFSGFEANVGNTFDSSSSSSESCRSFIFSGISGIDTNINNDVLTISYTGCKNPFTGFQANNSNISESSSSSSEDCKSLIVSGVSGIDTSISDNILNIAFTGSASGCNPFSGFQANSGNTYGLDIDGCTGFTFAGNNGIDTSITGNILNISYTGCQNPFSGFIATHLFQEYYTSGYDGTCRPFRIEGIDNIKTTISGDILYIEDTIDTFSLRFSGENCESFNGPYTNRNIVLDFDEESFFVKDIGSGPEVRLKGIDVAAQDRYENLLPNSRHIAREIIFQDCDLFWQFGDGTCDTHNSVTVVPGNRTEASGCLRKYTDTQTSTDYIVFNQNDLFMCLNNLGFSPEFHAFTCHAVQNGPTVFSSAGGNNFNYNELTFGQTGIYAGWFLSSGSGCDTFVTTDDPQDGGHCCDQQGQYVGYMSEEECMNNNNGLTWSYSEIEDPNFNCDETATSTSGPTTTSMPSDPLGCCYDSNGDFIGHISDFDCVGGGGTWFQQSDPNLC